MVCGATGVGDFGCYFWQTLGDCRQHDRARTGVIFPDRSPPERFSVRAPSERSRPTRVGAVVSLHQARAVLASTPRANLRTRARPQGYRHAFRPRGASRDLRPVPSPPRDKNRPPSAKTGVCFGFGSPEAPCGPGVSALPGPRRWPRSAATSPRDEISASELTDIPDSSRTWRVAERKVHPRQVQHLARLLRRLLRLGQGTHQRGARLVRRRIKVDDAPNLSPNRTIAPVLEIAWTDDDVAPFRAFAFVFAGRSPRRG